MPKTKTKNYLLSYFRKSAYQKAHTTGVDVPLIHTTLQAESLEDAQVKANAAGRVIVSLDARGRGRVTPRPEFIQLAHAEALIEGIAPLKEAITEESAAPSTVSEDAEVVPETLDAAAEPVPVPGSDEITDGVVALGFWIVNDGESDDVDGNSEDFEGAESEDNPPLSGADINDKVVILISDCEREILHTKEAIEEQTAEFSRLDAEIVENLEKADKIFDNVKVRRDAKDILDYEFSVDAQIEPMTDAEKERLAVISKRLSELYVEGAVLYDSKKEGEKYLKIQEDNLASMQRFLDLQKAEETKVAKDLNPDAASVDSSTTAGDAATAYVVADDCDDEAGDEADDEDEYEDDDDTGLSLVVIGIVAVLISGAFFSLGSALRIAHPEVTLSGDAVSDSVILVVASLIVGLITAIVLKD